MGIMYPYIIIQHYLMGRCVEESERKRGREGIEKRDPYLYDFLASHHQGVTSICHYTFWSGVAGLSADSPRADKPQHHDKRCNKMFITADWSLLGKPRAKMAHHPNKAMRVNVPFYRIRRSCSAARQTRSTLTDRGSEWQRLSVWKLRVGILRRRCKTPRPRVALLGTGRRHLKGVGSR